VRVTVIKRGSCATQPVAQARIGSFGSGIDEKTERLIGQRRKECAGRAHKILNIRHGVVNAELCRACLGLANSEG
jgi:hypothetical protein